MITIELLNNLYDAIFRGNTKEVFNKLFEERLHLRQLNLYPAVVNAHNSYQENVGRSLNGYLTEGDKNKLMAWLIDILEALEKKISSSNTPSYNNNNNIIVLMFTANPFSTTWLNLDREKGEVYQAIQHHSHIRLFIESNTNHRTFVERIVECSYNEPKLKPNIIHFSGHGKETDESLKRYGIDTGGLLLHDKNAPINGEVLTSNTLDAFFRWLKGESYPIECVVLNCCYSEEQAKVIAQYVPFVIGTTIAIKDEQAIEFSKHFYLHLAKYPDKIESAFGLGRVMAINKGASKEDFIIFVNGEYISEPLNQ